MGRRIFYARKTMNGGKCCSFSRRGMNMNAKACTSMQRQQDQPDMMPTAPPTSSVKTITQGRNIPSNKEVEKQKAKMNDVIQRLQKINVKKKNISFEI